MSKQATSTKKATAKQETFSGIIVKEGQTVTVRQARSFIGRDKEFRQTLRALGLGRIGKSRSLTATAPLLGMMRRVATVLEVSVGK